MGTARKTVAGRTLMWRYVVSAAVCSVLLAAAGAGGAGGAGEDWCGVVSVCGGGKALLLEG